MRRSVFVAVLLVGALHALPVAAQPAPTVESFQDAVRQLTRAEPALTDDRLPRLSDPVDGPLLRTAFDARVLPLLDWSDPGRGLDVCALSRDLQETYLVADVLGYQDEFVLATGFALRCAAQAMPALGRFWNSLSARERTPVRVGGLRQLRDGVAQMYEGALLLQSAPGLRDANRKRLLAALADSNAGLGGVLSPDQRTALVTRIRQMATTAPAADRRQIEKLGDELSALPCTGLCEA